MNMGLTKKTITILLFSIFLLNILLSTNILACKDIIAIGDATEGEYNLLMKVRDPSRPGLQVLTIVPKDYTYNYHHPWNGKTQTYSTKNKYIGVTTVGDTYPNTVKPGMALSSTGIAYGDADSNSNWINPTRHAWDDFDWIRYACEKAEDEDQAAKLMTKDVVDEMHATAVSENLFIVGPEKGYVIEADAYHYDITELKNGVIAMSNYPKNLWKTQKHKTVPIASSFEEIKEKKVFAGRTIRLNSIYGVKIIYVGENYIIARQTPFLKIINKIPRFMGKPVRIELNSRETVGDYSVKLQNIENRRAEVKVEYKFKAWEDKIMDYIQPSYGSIDIKKMMNWSRLHEEDLENLRPMCEDTYPYESVMIYSIPKENYEILSTGWFSANHACSSIYVPTHNCNTEIFDPYETGKAAELSLELLDLYDHDTLTDPFHQIEQVFLYETKKIEEIALNNIKNKTEVIELLTTNDISIQQQAWITQNIYKEIGQNRDNKKILEIIKSIWKNNYTCSINQMKNAIQKLKDQSIIIESIENIALNICKTKINQAKTLGKIVTNAEEYLQQGKKLIQQGNYEAGFENLSNSYEYSQKQLIGKNPSENQITKIIFKEIIIFSSIAIIIIGLILLALILFLIKKLYHST